MTTTYKDMSHRLASLAHAATSGDTAADYALRNRKARASQDIAGTAAVNCSLVLKLEQAAHLIGARFVTETTVAAGANSRNVQVKYDDGAGGAATALTTAFDGTASTATAEKINELTVTAGVAIPAGSRIFVNCAKNGTGAAFDETVFEVEYQYD